MTIISYLHWFSVHYYERKRGRERERETEEGREREREREGGRESERETYIHLLHYTRV